MSKICFLPKNFKPETLEVISIADKIVTGYAKMGYRMTLRQLYYQFVGKNLIPNTEKSYKRLASIVSDARLAGLIDWHAIEDRGRVVEMVSDWPDVKSLMAGAISSFRLPRWDGQPNYVELWVEKQALAGVLSPICYKFHLPLMVNKGYSSSSAMFAASCRYRAQKKRKGWLLYIGDHDPSGEDMVRDVSERMEMFGAPVNVVKLALTMDQIEAYNLPPNPAKTTDSRSEDYVAKHGDSSWEVDAMDTPALAKTITKAVTKLVDIPMMNKVIEKEKALKKKLKELTDKIQAEEAK